MLQYCFQIILGNWDKVNNNSQNISIQIDMNPQEDYRKKYTGLIPYKNNPAPLVAKERRKTDMSREKDDRKLIHPTERGNTRPIQTQDQNSKANNTKMINFRNLKDTIPKKEITQVKKNPICKTNNPNEYFQKGLRPSQSPNQGISINVNIQNLMPQMIATEPNQVAKSDRSQLGEEKQRPKKVALLHQAKKIDEFQCTEQLTFKKPLVEAKPKFQQKTVEKTASGLLQRKTHRLQIHTKVKQKQPFPQSEIKQTLKKFEESIETINSTTEGETFAHLDCRQSQYTIPPDYIQKCQKNFSWIMRGTLFEWILHVSYEFSMKRQTFYLAINLVDSFMCREHHLSKSQFQLAGAASMFIASKLDEFQPKSSEEFARATMKYSAAQIKEMELRILRVLKYGLNSPTLNMWANRLMLQWDTFLQVNSSAQRHPLFATCEPKFFKKNSDESYRAYRMMMQLIDCAALDIQTVQYKQKLLVCAFMYLVLGKEMGIFKTKVITNQFPRSSLYLIDDDNLFNDLFMSFLQESFNIALIDLLPTVQYTATYFILPMTFDEPITSLAEDEEMNFEDYCSYQTHNPHLLAVIKKRFRGIYE